MRFELNPVWRLNGDMRLFIVGIHALVAFCVAILIGALWSLHMRQEWRRKRNRLTGVTSAGSILLLILSGVGLYYLSNETLIRWTSGMHSILGLMLALVYCVHLALA